LVAPGHQRGRTQDLAIFCIVESCHKLRVLIRQYLAGVLPGTADRSIQKLAILSATAYAAKIAS